jgi:hypothetical protein
MSIASASLGVPPVLRENRAEPLEQPRDEARSRLLFIIEHSLLP